MQNTVEKKKIERNGVDVTALMETIRAIEEKPELADFHFRSRNEWQTGGHNRSYIKEFYGACQEDTSREFEFVFDNDEPPVLLGKNRGANPVEFVLHALAGCMTTTMVYHAASRGITIKSIRSRFEGDIDLRGMLGISDDVRKGYKNIRVTFDIESDGPADQLEELAKASPVFNTVSSPVDIDVTVNNKEIE